MELGAEISKKVKKTIKKQLQILGCYVDDELPEYIMVMIANKRTQEQMIDDLNLFLNDEADKFVAWLSIILARIQKAMELPDIDVIGEDVDESQYLKKKPKKEKRDGNVFEPSEIKKDDRREREGRRSDEQRRPNLSKEEAEEQNEDEKRRQERSHREREKDKEGKENDRRNKERNLKIDERTRQKEIALSREEQIRNEEISKRRAARERRDKEDKERREYKKRKEREEQEEKENKDKYHKERERRQHEDKRKHERRKSGDCLTRHEKVKETNYYDNLKVNGLEYAKEERKEVENETNKRIDDGENRSPMEFVNQIASDTNHQMMNGTGSNKDSDDPEVKTDGDVDFKMETVENFELMAVGENVSNETVHQYEEKLNDDKENDDNGEKDCNGSESRSRKHSLHRHRSSRSRSKSEQRLHNHEPRFSNKSRSSKSRSCEKNQHSQLRSHSKERQERKSRGDHERSLSKEEESSLVHVKTSDGIEDSRSQDNTASVDDGALKENDKDTSNQDHNDGRSSNESSSSKINSNDVVDEVEEHEETPDKPMVASKIQVYTDVSRKTSMPEHNEVSSVLLKRAVSEVVSENVEDNVEDDVELDYNDTNDENEFSDEASNDVFVERRRVINFDKEKPGLPTITVNFNKENSPNKENEKHTRSSDRDRARRSTTERGHHTRSSDRHSSSHRRSDFKDDERRKGHIDKNDARYTILRSRLEHDGSINDRKVRHDHKQDKSSHGERHHADIDDRSKRHNTRSSWRDHKTSHSERHERTERHRDRRSHRNEDDNDRQRQELSRSRRGSDEGDLRELLLGKRESKTTVEGDALSQRLREKIREEKHKRLPDKTSSEDKDRVKRKEDRETSRHQSDGKRRRTSDENDSPESIERTAQNGDRNEKSNLHLENVTSDTEEDEIIEYEDEGHGMSINEKEKSLHNHRDFDAEEDCGDNEDDDDDDGDSDDDDDDESQDDEGQQEHKVVPKNHIQDDLEEVSDEELADDSEKETDLEDEPKQHEQKNIVEGPVLKEPKELCEDLVEEEVEEEVEIEVEVSDNDNLDGDDDYIMSKEVNTGGGKSEMWRIIEGVEEDNIMLESDRLSLQPLKNNSCAVDEVSEGSPTQDEHIDLNNSIECIDDSQNSDRYARTRQRYTKRKKMRHEVIVTVDGLTDGKQLSVRASNHEKSPKVQRLQDRHNKSDRHRRYSRNTSRCKSDDEFEEVSRKKGEHDKHSVSRSRTPEGKKNYRPRSQSNNDKDTARYHELNAVDREIMIAENKLKAQKMFRKSLEAIQNVSSNYTVSDVQTSMDQRALKTFFNNSNYRGKLPVDGLNAFTLYHPMKPMIQTMKPIYIATTPILRPVCNLMKPMCSVPIARTETAKLVPTVVPSPPEKTAAAPLSSAAKKENVMPPTTPDIATKSPVETSDVDKNIVIDKQPVDAIINKDITPPPAPESLVPDIPADKIPTTITVDTNNDNTLVSSLPETPPASVESVSVPSPVPVVAKTFIQERCAFWPECKNPSCLYIHPSTNCKMFPNCSYGQHCIYIHPPCMFGDACSNAACQFLHLPSTPFPGFTQICKFYPNCSKTDCPFKHVDKVAKPCHFGAACKNPECIFSHDQQLVK